MYDSEPTSAMAAINAPEPVVSKTHQITATSKKPALRLADKRVASSNLN
jgi:hypothetical protein